ncbi:MAG: DinB family protein [Armatimonadota bacterium]
MDITLAILDSWDRQCRIVNAVAGQINETNANALPSADGWPISRHLAHMHNTRKYFLGQFDQELADSLGNVFPNGWDAPITDLDAIRTMLVESGVAVRTVVRKALEEGNEKVGFYDNAILYLQHMVWHEGWHVGLIFLALRLAGQEPSEEWEEEKVWGEWRTEVWEG